MRYKIIAVKKRKSLGEVSPEDNLYVNLRGTIEIKGPAVQYHLIAFYVEKAVSAGNTDEVVKMAKDKSVFVTRTGVANFLLALSKTVLEMDVNYEMVERLAEQFFGNMEALLSMTKVPGDFSDFFELVQIMKPLCDHYREYDLWEKFVDYGKKKLENLPDFTVVNRG